MWLLVRTRKRECAHMKALVRDAAAPYVHECACVAAGETKAKLVFMLEDCMTSLSLTGLLE